MNLMGLRSTAAEEIFLGEPRPLTEADIISLTETDRGRGKTDKSRQRLEKLTQRHHGLAKLIATGTRPRDAAFVMGYTQMTVSLLQADPTFQELVAFYCDDNDAAYRTMQAQLAGVGQAALEELERRLEEKPEELGAAFLLDVAVKAADRTGNGPSSTTKAEVNVNFGIAEKMAAARRRVAEATGQIEISARDITPEHSRG